MAVFLFANNASSTLAGPISNVATALNVASGQGALFPNPSAGQQFAVTMNDAATGLLTEIMYCTARSGDTLTVTRGQEGTTAQNWAAGDLIANLITAGQMQAMQQSALLFPARIVTASGPFTINLTDGYGEIGLNRTTALGTSSAALPGSAPVGWTVRIADLAKNFNAYPVTITPPGGMTIAGAANATLNVNGQVGEFCFEGSNLWSFKP